MKAPARPGQHGPTPAQDWTTGLRRRTANLLRAHGFTSREQVARLSAVRLLRLPGFGSASLADLQAWLGNREADA